MQIHEQEHMISLSNFQKKFSLFFPLKEKKRLRNNNTGKHQKWLYSAQ